MVKGSRTAKFTLLDFVATIRLDDCKLQNFPDFLFLCGGKVQKTGPLLSARDYFHRHIQSELTLASRIRLAEDVNEWFKNAWLEQDNAFSDLLDVENHLAHLAGMILLFVESPGSIAELGAFSASDDLAPKTFAILNEAHGFRNSFIADGPVRKLSGLDRNQAQFYNWNPSKPNGRDAIATFRRLTDDLTTFIKERDLVRSKQTDFKQAIAGHKLLLVADLVRLAGVVVRTELAECLNALGCDGSVGTVNRYLALLQSLDLIQKRRLRSEVYFVPTSRTEYVRYAFNEHARYRDGAAIQQALRASLDSHRKSIIRRSLRAPNRV